MDGELPIIVLPSPISVEKTKRDGEMPRVHPPSPATQSKRIGNQLRKLSSAIERQKLTLQQSTDGVDPEHALVFDVSIPIKSFGAVAKRLGFEWMIDFDVSDIAPDNEFYQEEWNPVLKRRMPTNESLTDRLYCVMADKEAVLQLLHEWQRYDSGELSRGQKGNAALYDLFEYLREVRLWGPKDRFGETGVLDRWITDNEAGLGGDYATFEVELFYRANSRDREAAVSRVSQSVAELDGRVEGECLLEEIGYHAIKVRIPRARISLLLSDQRENLEVAQCSDIMFFRPNGQMAIDVTGETTEEPHELLADSSKPLTGPYVAVLDGLPLENHKALRGRLVIDNPDEIGSNSDPEWRVHGTAMASLVVHGDTSVPNVTTLGQQVYVHPVLEYPTPGRCEVPPNEFIVDLVHRAVLRMIKGEAGDAPTAPNVKVINLSLGDPARQYLHTPSPLARLLDWLSCELNVLFVISAGNQELRYIPIEGGFSTLKEEDLTHRTASLGSAMEEYRRNLHLLSPAESLNGITVGATFDDFERREASETAHAIIPVEDGYLSPISSFGPGLAKSTKPEIVYPGGRFFVGAEDERHVSLRENRNVPIGIQTAVPSSAQLSKRYGHGAGTSYAAAAITHECGINLETLIGLLAEQGRSELFDSFGAVALKAMAAHGALGYSTAELAKIQFDAEASQRITYFGFGRPDFNRVRSCTKNRFTAIGFGQLVQNKGDEFRVPLPLDFRTRDVMRRLVVTLSYFSPCCFTRKEYRHADLWVGFPDEGEALYRLGLKPLYTDTRLARRGTLQHQVYEGSGISNWDEDAGALAIQVHCAGRAGLPSLGKTAVRYALMITFEVMADTDVYNPIVQRLYEPVLVAPNVTT